MGIETRNGRTILVAEGGYNKLLDPEKIDPSEREMPEGYRTYATWLTIQRSKIDARCIFIKGHVVYATDERENIATAICAYETGIGFMFSRIIKDSELARVVSILASESIKRTEVISEYDVITDDVIIPIEYATFWEKDGNPVDNKFIGKFNVIYD